MKKSDYVALFLILSYCLSIDLYALGGSISKVTLSITGEKTHDIVLEILNIYGQTLKTEKIGAYENEIEVSLEGLSKGTYFIRITYSGNSVIKTIILQ